MHGRNAPAPGASALAFTPDCTRLVLCTAHGSFVHVLQLPTSSEAPHLLRSFAQHRTTRTALDGRVLSGGHGQAAATPTPIVLAAVSSDGQWLVTADTARRMHVFHLDTLSHQRALATPAYVPSGACFHPTHPSLLALVLPTNQVSFYDLEADGEAPAWEAALRRDLDAALSRIREPVVGCTWLPGPDGHASLLSLIHI